MWGILSAFGVVGLVVKLAMVEKSDDPILRPALQKRKLAKILKASRRRALARSEAEDGLVLARRLGEANLARWFEEKVREAKEKSGSVRRDSGQRARRL
jgi:hypothetical protein